MTEYRFVTFTQPTSRVFPTEAGTVGVLTVDFLDSVPQLAEHMDGWEPVNFQVVPNGELTYLTVLLRGEMSVPQVD